MDRRRDGGRGARRALILALSLAALAAGCTKRDADERPGLGTRVHEGRVRAVKASPDGAWLAFLEGCSEARAQSLPPGTANCELRVAPAAGGGARRVAAAVTTLPHGFAWSPGGDLLAALADYDYVNGAGTLVLVDGGGEPARVADEVTFHGFVPGEERVAAVAGGRLVRAAPGVAPEWMPGIEGLSSFELSPSRRREGPEAVALLRRSARLDGALLAVASEDGRAAQLAERTGDYAFAPGGKAFAFTVQGPGGYELRLARPGGPPERIGRGVQSFAFSPDGAAIAFVGDAEPGRQGNLHLRPIAGPDAIAGREVGEFRWARSSTRVAWLERYDPRVRSGELAVAGPGIPTRTFGRNVSDFDISADGTHVAYLEHTTRGGYSVDLALARVGAPKGTPPRSVAQGAFGFSFSPDGRWLYYRTRCTRNGEACDLERVPVAEPGPGAKAEGIAQGVKSFEFDPRDAERLLVTWQRADLVALDVAVWEKGKLTVIDRAVLPGSAQFVGPDSRRVAYAVAAPKRAGVYVAEVPR